MKPDLNCIIVVKCGSLISLPYFRSVHYNNDDGSYDEDINHEHRWWYDGDDNDGVSNDNSDGSRVGHDSVYKDDDN